MAIVTLVDGPKDLKFEMTARAVARETAEFDQVDLETVALRPNTKRAVEQVLKYRSEEDKGAWNERIGEHKVSAVCGSRRNAKWCGLKDYPCAMRADRWLPPGSQP